MSEQQYKICRILIGDKSYIGKGYGVALTKVLVKWVIQNFNSENIYDFNKAAIRAYKNAGFVIVNENNNVLKYQDEYWNSYTMKYMGT
jgi:RimJ/RimL family protein N-acetyltransferase